MSYKSPIFSFIVRAAMLYACWLIAFYYWGSPRGGFDDQMTVFTAGIVTGSFEKMGYETSSQWVNTQPRKWEEGTEPYSLFITLDNHDVISMNNRCNGLFILVIYMGFIVAYPGRIKPKIFFIVFGSIAIFLSNVIRVQVLIFNWIYFKSTFDFNHKYTYTFVLYSLVFVLWMWWVNKYSNISLANKMPDQEIPAT